MTRRCTILTITILFLVFVYSLYADEIFTDDFNDGDFTDKWDIVGSAEAFVEEAGVLKAVPFPSGGSEHTLKTKNVNVVASAEYKVDFEITFKDGNASGVFIFIGNENNDVQQRGTIRMSNFEVGVHSVMVEALDSSEIKFFVGGTGGGAWFNNITVTRITERQSRGRYNGISRRNRYGP